MGWSSVHEMCVIDLMTNGEGVNRYLKHDIDEHRSRLRHMCIGCRMR